MSVSDASPIHGVRFPGESDDYRQARDRLLESEIALRRQIEAVAAQRRALPPGGPTPEDYVFEEGDEARSVRLSELFGGKQTLILYSYMFGPRMERPCPSCTSILDALDGEAAHITQRVALAVAARSPIARIRQFAAERGWRRLRLVSSANNRYHSDYHGESVDGAQQPILNVFTREGATIRHRYASELMFAPRDPGQDPRHVDAIWPLWSALDLTPEGRGEFQPKLAY
ncbi:MAG: DUF899 family protein [Caulobacteraceae bacterium]|nr:DUF899 family protein [Caulobacteraceae bacterium]